MAHRFGHKIPHNELKVGTGLSLKLSRNHECYKSISNPAFIGDNHSVSIISRLPQELLQEIFIHSLPNEIYIHPKICDAPLKLGLVCRIWRNASLTCPRLWTSISISIAAYSKNHSSLDSSDSSESHNIYEQLEMGVKTWLSRSGSLPLSIRYRSALRVYGLPAYQSIQRVWEVIAPFASRWRNLDIESLPDIHLLDFFAPRAHMLHLRELVITLSTWRDHPVDLSHLNNLESLEIRGHHCISTEVIILPSHLRHLSAGRITHHRAVQFLLKCTSLISVRFEIFYPHPDTVLMEPIVLPHLEILLISYRSYTRATHFWDWLTLPALKMLEFGLKSFITPFPPTSIPSLLVRSHCDLDHLLVRNGFCAEDIIHCLSTSPNLQHLTLWSTRDDSFPSMLSSVLDRLLEVEGRHNFTLCPKLCKLSIRDCGPFDNYLDSVFNFVSTRWCGEICAADKPANDHVKEIELTCGRFDKVPDGDALLRRWDSYFENNVKFQQCVPNGLCVHLTIGSTTYFYGPSCCQGKRV